RRFNRAVPRDLETIVLKAMAKEPSERYATAQELADDLRRFLEDKPIKAKRPSVPQRVAKWSRRHRTLVWSALVLLFVLMAAGIALGWREWQWNATALQREAAQRGRAGGSYLLARPRRGVVTNELLASPPMQSG